MHINYKINSDLLDKLISYRINQMIKISKIMKIDPNIAFIYQLSIIFSIRDWFTKIVENIKRKNLLTLEIYLFVYKICEKMLSRKFKSIYLHKKVDKARADFLRFAKVFYKYMNRPDNTNYMYI